MAEKEKREERENSEEGFDNTSKSEAALKIVCLEREMLKFSFKVHIWVCVHVHSRLLFVKGRLETGMITENSLSRKGSQNLKEILNENPVVIASTL